jgi:hypothetical protein
MSLDGTPPPAPLSPPPSPPIVDILADLNEAAYLDFRTAYNRLSHNNNDDVNDPYEDLIIDSKFYDINTISTILHDNVSPIYLSINIQSLMSKYDELRAFVSELYSKKIPIDVIAIQEVWEIRQPELLPIPGFQTLIFKSRKNMRGGGSGLLCEGRTQL